VIEYLFAKVYFMFYQLILFFVTLWQKTRVVRSIFQFSECRFYPSCSDYFLKSLEKYGPIYGIVLSLKRLLRCNPLCEGGIDHVPNEFTSYRLCPIHSAKLIKRKELTEGSSSLS